MELDSHNMLRLYKVCRYRIIKNRRTLVKNLLAYLYLFGSFVFFALFFSYNIRLADKPIGYIIVLMITPCIYLFYVLLNHMLVRSVVSHKILLLFDMLTLIMLICILLSDIWAENYRSQFVN